MLRKGSLSFLIVVVVALLVFVLTTAFLAEARGVKSVLVARKALPVGTRLDEKVVEVREMPAAAVAPLALTSVEEAKGQVLTAARMPGDQITREHVGDRAISGIAAGLEPGERAVAVRVDRATGLAGILHPGDRVTVVGIIDPQAAGGYLSQSLPQSLPASGRGEGGVGGGEVGVAAGATAMVTLSGLRVLLVPQGFRYQEIAEEEGGGLPLAPVRTTAQEQEHSVILLAVPTAPQAFGKVSVNPVELLALLNAVGRVHLVLEPAGGSAPAQAIGVRLADVYGVMAAPKPTVTPTPKAK